ncbi:hypothetical protein MMC22_010809 [Lobaria immixta]|nr:hypothetical protein [Lobaria immixta]
MDQTRSYAVEIDGYAQPQRRFAPLNAGLQSTVYAVHRTQWGVAIQEFDESSYLLPTPLYDWDSVEQALIRAREQLSKISRQKYPANIAGERSRPATSTLIYGIVSVSRILNNDPLLTEIFHKSTHLTGTARTFPFSSAGIDDYQGQRIIVVRRVLDKFKIARLLILLLLISPAFGTVVATVAHRAGVGVAVSTGVGVAVSVSIFGLASFLQALATWFET